MSCARDFLVELGTEELPPLALPELERAFGAGVVQGVKGAGLPLGDPRTVQADAGARYFGALLDERTLVPAGKARLGTSTIQTWLQKK